MTCLARVLCTVQTYTLAQCTTHMKKTMTMTHDIFYVYNFTFLCLIHSPDDG